MHHDTIVAIATPPGRGALGIVRISGPDSPALASALTGRRPGLEPRKATVCRLVLNGRPFEEAIVTVFPAPHSFTGEHVVEISAHGSPVLLREIVEASLARGARLAERGEFTLRAFLNGRLDLVQAEAVGDLIAAVTPRQARAAFDQLDGTLTGRIAAIDRALLDVVARLEASLDFPEEGYRFIEPAAAAADVSAIAADVAALVKDGRRGRIIREGATVAIVGRPNVGKSSLFNRLAGVERAIVTPEPGTTRDLVTETVDLLGFAVTLVDTAGLREPEGRVEEEGVRRARRSAETAQAIVVVLDGSEPLTPRDLQLLDETRGRLRVVVANKSDLSAVWHVEPDADTPLLRASACTGTGVEAITQAIARALGDESGADDVLVTNVRHLALLERSLQALHAAAEAAKSGAFEELVLEHLHEARGAIEEVTGRRSTDDLLEEIFSRFCIGK